MINILKSELTNMEFVCRKVMVKDKIVNIISERETVLICIKRKDSSLLIPHPLSYFILQEFEYKDGSINTYFAFARTVCRFMNFVISRIQEGAEDYQDLRKKGIYGLRRFHGVEFLNYKTSEKRKRNTVKDYDYHLSRFFVFLLEKGWLNENFTYQTNENGNVTTVFNDINGLTRYLPRQTETGVIRKAHKLKDFGKSRFFLVPLFIQTATEIAPDIALGICFEFFGGLRRGEVVNITRANIHEKSRKTLVIDIRDNRKILFSRLKDTSNEYPKRLRYLDPSLARQQIYTNDLVWEIFYQHLKQMDIDFKKGKLNNYKTIQPLFYDSYGQPMSAKVFEKRFKKVKEAFLEKIKMHEDYLLFKDSSWSTHIGRGCFTNLLMDLGFSVTQIAIARGDTNVDSAMEYVDTKLSHEATKAAMNILNNLSHEQYGIFDKDMLKEIKARGRIYGESRVEIEYY
ncbi:site-specific integrase [Niallia sp. MER 6]|uniref:site-specific integrase n=1 Tax=Niallia sp. MER 6 TaxID=2939567 RepID=UPI002040594E|nr:site-specific integrase [Niallia sp. MER 6]MCM3031402.1 site-specific integrase [Niallia sp. MER 6]